MKRGLIIALIVVVVLGAIYLYLLGVVNVHQREFKEMREGSPDSIRINDTIYYNKKNN